MTATIFNIDFTGSQTADTNDNLLNAHIHAGATSRRRTTRVVWGFIGTPVNDTNPDGHRGDPVRHGGRWDGHQQLGCARRQRTRRSTAQLPNIFAGRSYINFHTVQFPGGEIRGQLTAVPEPSSIALAGIGAIGLIGYGWLRTKRTRRHVSNVRNDGPRSSRPDGSTGALVIHDLRRRPAP